MPLYRVYFTVRPTEYHVITAGSAKAAVWHAKRHERAMRLNKRRTAPLVVEKIERVCSV